MIPRRYATVAVTTFLIASFMSAAVTGQDQPVGIKQLEGRWKSTEIVHYGLLFPGAKEFHGSNFHADVKVKSNYIEIKETRNGENRADVTFYGKINGPDVDSFKWTCSYGTSIEVLITPDYEHIHIYRPMDYNGHTEPRVHEYILSR